MSESNGTADAVTVTDTPAQGIGHTAEVDTAAASMSAPDESFISKKEFVELAKLTRSLRDEVQSLRGNARTSKPEKSDTADAGRIADLEFRVLVSEQAPHLSGEQRARLSKLFRSDAPPDAVSWMRDEIAALGWNRSTQAQPTPPAKAAHLTNTGAPGSSGGPANLADAVKDAETYRNLSPADRKMAWEAYRATDPSIGRTFAKR